MKVRILLAILLATATGIAQAQGQKKKGNMAAATNTGGYGMAGCGLGSIVLGNEPGMMQVLAATLNSTGVQTFGLTTGTSNCGGISSSAKVDQFIEVNKVALENDLSRGQGESLASLSEMMGCSSQDFSQTLKQNYGAAKAQGGDVSPELMRALAEKSCHI